MYQMNTKAYFKIDIANTPIKPKNQTTELLENEAILGHIDNLVVAVRRAIEEEQGGKLYKRASALPALPAQRLPTPLFLTQVVVFERLIMPSRTLSILFVEKEWE